MGSLHKNTQGWLLLQSKIASLVQEAMQAEELDTFFMLPLSVEALDELEPLHYKRKNLNGYQLGLDSAVRSHRWRPGWRRRW